MGEDTNKGVQGTSQKDPNIRGNASLTAVIFQEVFIVPDTKEIYFFETFEDSNYDDFNSLVDKQQALAKANEEVKKESVKVSEALNEKKKTAAIKFKEQVQLNMDKELKSAKMPKVEASETFNNALKKADQAFIDCDEAIKNATGGAFKDLVKEEAKPVEVLSLTRNRPILLAADKFEELKSKAKVVEKGSEWVSSGGTEDNDFMGLVRSLKDTNGDYQKKTIAAAFKNLNGSVKIADWPDLGDGAEGNASFGSQKLADILKDINDNAEVSTDKDALLRNAIMARLDDDNRKSEFTVDDAEYVISSLRDLYGKKNDKAPVNPEFEKFVTDNLGDVMDTYNEDPDSLYFTVPKLTDSSKGKKKRKDLLGKIDELELPPKMWDASASAKILRYSATAGGSMTCDLKEGIVNYNLKAEGKFDLVDAKAETNCYLPSDRGAHLSFSAKVRKVNAKYNKPVEMNKDDASFFHDSSFVAACTAQGLLVNLNEAREKIIATNTDAILNGVTKEDRGYVALVGKADKSGSDAYNDTLSMYRVLAAYAFINKDVDAWFSFFEKGIWGQTEANYMIKILCADKNSSDQLEKEPRSPASYITSLFTEQALFPGESGFLNFGYTSYPSDKYTEYFERIPEGKMESFGSSYSLYSPVDLNWKSILKKRIEAYFNLVHSTVEEKEGINAVNTKDLLITRGNIFAVGESQASRLTPNKSVSDRTVDVLCYTIDLTSIHEDSVDGVLDFGHVRILLKGYVSAWAGVEASVTAGLEVKMDELKVLKGFQPEELSAEEKKELGANAPGGSKKKEKGKDVKQGASLGAAASAFAGVKAEAGAKALLEWLKPEAKYPNFSHLAEAGYSVSGMAGAGASADFKIGFDTYSRKFVCKMKAEATLGLGCGGCFSFAISANTLIDFVILVHEKLKDVDFSYLDIFETKEEGGLVDVYKLYSQTLLELIKSGNVVGTLTAVSAGVVALHMAPLIALGGVLQRKWDLVSGEEEKKGLKELAECINGDSEILEYLNPETKGRILYLLCKYSISSFWEDALALDWNQKNEELALKLIEKGIKSKRDYQETISHMLDFKKTKQSRKINEQVVYVSEAKSAEDVKSKAEIVNKKSRIQKGEKWLKDVLFTDTKDSKDFDELTQQYQ
jgi:hypothetical protein